MKRLEKLSEFIHNQEAAARRVILEEAENITLEDVLENTPRDLLVMKSIA